MGKSALLRWARGLCERLGHANLHSEVAGGGTAPLCAFAPIFAAFSAKKLACGHPAKADADRLESLTDFLLWARDQEAERRRNARGWGAGKGKGKKVLSARKKSMAALGGLARQGPAGFEGNSLRRAGSSVANGGAGLSMIFGKKKTAATKKGNDGAKGRGGLMRRTTVADLTLAGWRVAPCK